MKALLLDKTGPPDTLPRILRVGEAPDPEPGPGEVRVKVRAVGLNPVDYKVADWGNPKWIFPHILGLDVAGTVDAVGRGVSEWKPGDNVYYHGDLSKPGGFAEYAAAFSHIMAPLPRNLSFEEAAALPCAGFTAYQAVHRKAGIKAGQTILVQGGAGGVGGFAIQLAKITGLEILTTCSKRNFDFVRRLGADHPIDYNSEDVAARVREITGGRGVDVIIDTISPESATAGLEMIAFNGQVVCIVGLPDISDVEPYSKGLSVHEVALGGAHISGDRPSQEDLARMAREMGHLAGEGRVDAMLSETITLEQIPDRLVKLAERHVRGKIVASIGE